MTDRRPSTPWPFVVSLAVLATSAAALILLIPRTVDGTGAPVWPVLALGGLTVIAGTAARRLRPSASL